MSRGEATKERRGAAAPPLAGNQRLERPLNPPGSAGNWEAARARRGAVVLKQRQTLWWCGTYEVGGGYPDEGFGAQGKNRSSREQGSSKLEPAQYEALLKGGEQVTSVLEEMIVLLEDMNMDEASEEVAVEIAAQGGPREESR